ncbi:MAG: DUF2442 domain-containing protein [Clostridiales bacterium]|nr:DUF2442 domain-containing protein [Clostridiales bacterium]
MLQPRLLSVAPADNFTLLLKYETGESKVFDVKPHLSGAWFGELKDVSYFRTVQLLPGGFGIQWKNGQDIAPHELYELSVPLKSEGQAPE